MEFDPYIEPRLILQPPLPLRSTIPPARREKHPQRRGPTFPHTSRDLEYRGSLPPQPYTMCRVLASERRGGRAGDVPSWWAVVTLAVHHPDARPLPNYRINWRLGRARPWIGSQDAWETRVVDGRRVMVKAVRSWLETRPGFIEVEIFRRYDTVYDLNYPEPSNGKVFKFMWDHEEQEYYLDPRCKSASLSGTAKMDIYWMETVRRSSSASCNKISRIYSHMPSARPSRRPRLAWRVDPSVERFPMPTIETLFNRTQLLSAGGREWCSGLLLIGDAPPPRLFPFPATATAATIPLRPQQGWDYPPEQYGTFQSVLVPQPVRLAVGPGRRPADRDQPRPDGPPLAEMPSRAQTM